MFFFFKSTKRHDFLIAVIALYPDNRFDLVFVPETFIQFRIVITAVDHEMAASLFLHGMKGCVRVPA